MSRMDEKEVLMAIIYQPIASGEDCLGHFAIRYGRKVYASQVSAQAAIPEFMERLARQGDHDLGYLEKIENIKIIELELVENDHAD